MDDRFVRAIFGAAETLGETLTEVRVRGYWSILGHYGTDRIVEALAISLRINRWFPRPCELIDILDGNIGNTEADAIIAWVALLEILKTPAAKDLCDRDPRVAAGVKAAGGLYDLRFRPSGEDDHWKQRKFIHGFTGWTRLRRLTSVGAPSPVSSILAGMQQNRPILDDPGSEK